MKKMKLLTILLAIVVMGQSCTDYAHFDEIHAEEQHEFQNLENNSISAQETNFANYCDGVSPSTYETAKIFGLFADNLTKDGPEVSLERLEVFLETLNSYGSDTLFTLNEITELYTTHLNMDSAITYNYFNFIMQNSSSLLNMTEVEKKELSQGLLCYHHEVNSSQSNIDENSVERRWIIKSLLKAAGIELGCAGKVTVGVIETGLLAAGTVVSSPTGVGAALGAAGTAASYIDTLNDAMDCL